jgi:hypothetical protein
MAAVSTGIKMVAEHDEPGNHPDRESSRPAKPFPVEFHKTRGIPTLPPSRRRHTRRVVNGEREHARTVIHDFAPTADSVPENDTVPNDDSAPNNDATSNDTDPTSLAQGRRA